MLTDLHLQKFLDGQLSEAEEKELEILIEKNPALKARLEELENRSQVIGKSMWQRGLLERKTKRGTTTRYGTILPGMLVLVVILLVAQHWFSPPGVNSTFTLSGGSATGLELLYDSEKGWRYLDADFGPEDALTFSIRDSGTYHVAVFAVYGRDAGSASPAAGSPSLGPEVATLWQDSSAPAFSPSAKKPTFSLPVAQHPGLPDQLIVVYDDTPLPALPRERVLDLLRTQGVERGGIEFDWQVFSSGK